ncbi:MAG: hypothetical protein ABIK64_08045, partial [Bacillota bacterium]
NQPILLFQCPDERRQFGTAVFALLDLGSDSSYSGFMQYPTTYTFLRTGFSAGRTCETEAKSSHVQERIVPEFHLVSAIGA